MENLFDEILGDMEQKFPFMNESEREQKAIELAEKQFEDMIPYWLHFTGYLIMNKTKLNRVVFHSISITFSFYFFLLINTNFY